MGVHVITARNGARLAAIIGAFVMLVVPSPAGAAQQQQNRQTTPKKVWTNEDVQRLKERDAISVVGIGSDIFDVDEPAPAAQGAKTKVWTNEDLQKLRQDSLSIVPSAEQAPLQPASPAATAPTAAAPEAAPAEAPYSRFGDPAWYAEQAYDLHVQLAQRQAALYEYQRNVALAHDAVTQPGVGLFEGDEGITLEAGVQNLELQVREIEIELEKLSDLARRNGIAPGVLRG